MSAHRPPIRALLIDLSGTLHVGSQPTADAVHALSRLRRQRIPFRFCSNTSKEGAAELARRLRGMGFELSDDDGPRRELWTSLGAAGSLLQKRDVRRPLCLLEPTARDEVMRALPPAPEDAPHDAVVVGLAPSLFSYEHLNAAFRVLLSRPPPPLIATHRAKYVRVEGKAQDSHETLSLGPGPFVAALENAAGVQAEVVGKPTRAFFEAVIDSFDATEIPAEGKIAIVGDDVETDLGGGAVELGLWRVLVRTGKYRPGDEHRPGIVAPDEVYDSFAAFVESLLGRG